jgi:hypothetical protein
MLITIFRMYKFCSPYVFLHSVPLKKGCTNPGLNFVRWRVLFVGPHYGTYFMSYLGHLEF